MKTGRKAGQPVDLEQLRKEIISLLLVSNYPGEVIHYRGRGNFEVVRSELMNYLVSLSAQTAIEMSA